MRTVVVKELSDDAFKLFGDFKNMLSTDEYRLGQEGNNEFRPDIMQIDMGNKTPSFSIAKVSGCEMVIENIEYHRFASEGLIPLDGDCIIFVGRSSWMVDTASIEAFRVPMGTLVRLNPGVLHGRQFVTGNGSVNIMVILPMRTYGNDCEFIPLKEEEKIKIKMD